MKIRQFQDMLQRYVPSVGLAASMAGKGPELGLEFLEAIIEQSQTFVTWKKDEDDYAALAVQRGLSDDELLAIAMYSYDVGEREKNLFYVLNNDLRVRQAAKMQLWCPYLYFLYSGLRKLPAVQGDVYRGIDTSALVKQHYKQQREIFWSAFSSTTSSFEVAKDNFSGGTGVIFRIKVVSGRNIQPLSVLPQEDEVLLSPNCRFLVTNALHSEGNLQVVDLMEISGDPYKF
jgi:hypothetical protein